MTDTFNFPFHTVAEEYPETGFGVQFGNSYEFRSAPTAPAQRSFKLSMMGLRYITDGGNISRTASPTVNYLTFKDFYRDHQMHQSFFYVHETEGTLLVRFAEPVKFPTAVLGGTGLFPTFEVALLEQP
jgi:hypothetical protein